MRSIVYDYLPSMFSGFDKFRNDPISDRSKEEMILRFFNVPFKDRKSCMIFLFNVGSFKREFK